MAQPAAHACSHSEPPTCLARRAERAFTLVELVVGAVLLIIVVAMVAVPLVNALRGASDTSTSAAAQRAVEDIEDRFASDVMAAYSPDRDRNHLRADSKFERALTANATLTSDDPSQQGRQLQVHDVLEANTASLVVRADVLASPPGTECVRYTAATTGGRFRLTRTVSRGTIGQQGHRCGSVVRTEQLVKDAPVVQGITNTRVFRFGVLDGRCRVVFRDGAAGTDLNRIVSVQLRVGAIIQRGHAASAARGESLVAIRSRDSGDYRRAIGC